MKVTAKELREKQACESQVLIFEKEMTETELLSNIIDAAHTLHYQVVHFRPARVLRNGRETWETPVQGNGKGFPDLILVRERVIFVECKSRKGKLTLEQDEWLTRLTNAGEETHIWKPKDWFDETILRILQLQEHKRAATAVVQSLPGRKEG